MLIIFRNNPSSSFKKILLLLLVVIIKAKAVFAQTDLKVGTSPGLITPSAVFEASSTNKGILIPRMTTAQMNAISAPANGLMIFNTDKSCMHLYNGTSWRNLCVAVGDSAWSLLGNSGTVAGTNFLGTRDAQSLVFKTNNSTAVTVPVESRGGQLIFSNNRYGGGGYPSRVGYQDLWGINSGDIDTSFSIMGSIGADDFFYIGGQAKSKAVSTSGELHIVSGDDGDEPIIFEQYNYATTTINERLRINNIGHVGIGISTPQYKLDIDANSKGSGNPLRLLGLQAGATTDSILTSASGVVRRMAFSQLASNTSWDLLGNSGTVDGTNFIGTTDNVPFNIRVNNQKAGRVASNGATLYGYQAGNANTTMNTLTAYGYQAGYSNTTALNGYFSGYQAGYSNATGNYNHFSGYQAGYTNATGTYNHFEGYQAGYSNNGSRNTFIGPLAGQSTTTNDNTAIGYVALRNNTTGFYNVAVGGGALGANTTGSYLVAMGYNALGANTTGTENTGLGHVALSSNTIGGGNTALGSNSLRSNTTGGFNTAMGYRSLVANTTGNNNVGIGYSALDANSDGHSNTAIGVSSMITNTSGNTNTAVGRGSLYYNTTGVSNNALGADALYSGTTGSYNIGIGQGVAYYNQTGNNNIIIGHQAGRGTTTNSFSNGVFIGYQAGYNNGTANNNNFIGYQSGLNNTTGTNNSFVGYSSGNTNTTGSNNTLLGHNSNVGAVALTNATAIGANAVVGASNSLVLGGTGTSAVNVGINTTTPQYKLDIDANAGSGNPLRLLGLQAGAGTDSILTSASGVVRRMSVSQLGTGNFWKLGGNTEGALKTLGTLDNYALPFVTNNAERMRITEAGSVGIGTSTPNQQLEITAAFRMPNTTSATTGVIYKDNLPFIHNYKPSANDGNNTFIGLDAGNFTMSSATSTQASNNTGVGASVLKALTTGFGNTAIGRNALTATTAGAVNVAIGNNALAATTTGSTNVAIGGSALELNTTGSGNVAIGFATLSNSTTTSTNTAVGMTALRYNTSGTSNTAVGNGALTSNTTGNTNTAVGESALYNNTIGIGNSAFGQSALSATTSGSYNTAMGLSSLQSNTTGAYNLAIGYGSMVNNSTGSYNVSLGTNSFTNLGSSNNVGIGYQAGNATISGGNNTFLGYQTGLTNASGSSNTLVGYKANVSTAALTNATALGANAIVGASNSLVLGGTGTSAVNVGINTTTPQYKLDIDANAGSGNPLRLLGLQAGAGTDSILTSASGVVRRMSFSQLSSNTAWALLGNSGTVDGTNFIGTTDNVPLNFRVNNQRAGRITNDGITLLGYQAGNATSNTSSTHLTALGYQSGYSNTTGSYNYFGGYQSGYSNTTGSYNYFIGYLAGYSNTTGANNQFIGYRTGYSNTTGSGNLFLGVMSGANNATGNYNTFLGHDAGRTNTTGSSNLFFGQNAGSSNTVGNENLYMGHDAGFANIGNYNIMIGNSAGSASATTNNNVMVGYRAGYSNLANDNQFMGYRAGFSNTTGINNSFIGYSSGNTNTTGSNNTLLGYNSNVGAVALTNATAIGANAIVGASNSLVLGGTGTSAVNVGINTTTPQYKLDIDANTGGTGNPLRLLGLQAGAGTDSILTSASGVVRRMSVSQLGNGNFWKLGGNTEGALKTLGTLDNYALPFVTNNTERMRITETGKIGIGTSSPSGALTLYGTSSLALPASIQGSSFASKEIVFGRGGVTNGMAAILGVDSGTHGGGLSFITKNNTGLDNFPTGAVQAMVIDWNGNIGMGTGSPYSKLDINGTALLRSGNSSNGYTQNQLLFGFNGATDYLHSIKTRHNAGSLSGNAMDFYVWRQGVDAVSNTVGTEHVMTLDGNIGGSVGIGTTTPQYKLDIDANTGGTGNPLRLLGLQAGAGTDSILTSASGVVRRMGISQLGNGNFWKLGGNTEGALKTLGTLDNYALPFVTNNAERMRITETGNVGIGTNAPVSKLSIVNDGGGIGYADDVTIFSYGTSFNPGYDTYSARGTASAPSDLQNGDPMGRVAFNGYYNGGFNNHSMTGMQAFYKGSGTNVLSSLGFMTSGQYNMTLDQTGNLGIGTTTPLYKLDVVGTGLYRNGNSGASFSQNQILFGWNSGATYMHSIKTRHNNGAAARNSMDFYVWKYGTDAIDSVGTQQVMTLDGNVGGSVGIGTTAPAYKLDIVGSDPLRLIGLNAGASTDSILTSASGVVRRMSMNQLGNGNFWKLGGNTEGVLRNLGTTDNVALPFITNNTERMRIMPDGKIGVGTNNPDTYFNIVGGDVAMGKTIGTITTFPDSSNKFFIRGDRGNNSDDMYLYSYYQPGEVSSLRINVGDNGATAQDFLDIGSSDYANLRWYNWMAVRANGVGIGTTTPAYKLDIVGSDPVRLIGLNAGATTDSILTSASGVVRRMAFSQLANNTSWSLLGNSGTNASTNFLGTTDNVALSFRTNNVRSGFLGTSATNNLFMGYNAGATVSTGTGNTLIGASTDVSTGTLTNATAIGNGAIVDASNKIRLGNTSVTLVETYGSIVTISDLRLKKNITDNSTGLKFIKDLRPVHYELKDTAHKGIIYDGFIAQEIESIMKRYNFTFSGLSKPTTEGGHYTVNYATFVVPLVNAVKELDVKNEQLADENARLKAEIEKMKAENATLKTSVDKNTKDIEAIKAMLEAKNK